MRSVALVGLIVSCASGGLLAQESSLPDAQPKMPEVYVVQLTEYRLPAPVETARTAAEIVKTLTDAQGDTKHEPIETIRFTTLSGTESLVQFGKRMRVSIGSATVRGGITHQYEFIQIGTIVRATATPQAGKVVLQLQFESSRLDGEATADSAPNVATTEFSSTNLLEIGRPTLVGGSTAGASTFLVVTITR